MKKVLIYFPERNLLPVGGPAGYLNNLRNGLQMIEHDDIDISFYQNAPVQFEENQSLRNRIPKRLKDIRRAYKFSKYLKRNNVVDESLFGYDAIHFHKTEDMYLNREFLSQYKGKVILTSHTPCVPYQEIIGRLNPQDYRLFKRKIDALIEMDRYAFERADYIIFPCEEAEEPYYHTWKEYVELRKSEKYKYMPTGIVGCNTKITRDLIREKYHIPSDAFVISYAGRHNEIKGYGDLKEIGKRLLEDHKDVYFIIAGKEGPLYKLNEDHWIEVGWTNDPHSIISASDIFVLPNHETYFDLILLEVISLGIPVLMTSTGGNNYFKQFSESALMFYTTVEEACDILVAKRESIINKRLEHKESLKTLFAKNFSIDVFSKRYVDILREILSE